MSDRRLDLVRIDETGVARPLDRLSVQRLKGHRGTYRVVPSPSDFVLLKRDERGPGDGDASPDPRVRLAGEVGAPGSLCEIVAMVAQTGWKGELVVLGGTDDDGPSASRSARSIWFEEGHVVAAASSASAERLGEIMYRLGALTREQVSQISKRTTVGRRFGEVAVDAGLLPRERVYELVRIQTEEIVYAALRVAEGTFWFLDGSAPPRAAHRQRLAAQGLLMEGVRRMDEAKYFRERIPSAAHVPIPLPTRTPPRDEELRRVLSACDGDRSVAEVGRALGLPEFDTVHALYGLVQGGFLAISPPRPTDPEAIVGAFNQVIRAILAAADAFDAGAGLRAHLASFASGVGVYDALFAGAGPHADGALDPLVVARNVAPLAGDDPTTALGQWLHEYASFALFDAMADLPREPAEALAAEVVETIWLLAPRDGEEAISLERKSRSSKRDAPALRPRPSPVALSTAAALAAAVPPSAKTKAAGRTGPPPLPSSGKLPAAPSPVSSAGPSPVTRPSLPPPPRRPQPAQPTQDSAGISSEITVPVDQPPYAPVAAREGQSSSEPVAAAIEATTKPSPFEAPTPTTGTSGLSTAPFVASATPASLPHLFDDTVDPVPAPEVPLEAARIARRRTLRRALTATAMALFAAAFVGTLFVAGIVRWPGNGAAESPVAAAAGRPRAAEPAPAPRPEAKAAASTKAEESEASAEATPPSTKGRLLTDKSPAGFRVFVDGRVVGSTPETIELPCGVHQVKIGSQGVEQAITVPCGGEFAIGR
jgi:hypothetical protein